MSRRNKSRYSRNGAPTTPSIATPSPNNGQQTVQHIDTFVSGINQYSNRLYLNPDEAYRQSRGQQSAMRRDPVIMQPLRERQLGTALRKWQIVPEDQGNQEQKQVCEELTNIVKNIPNFLKLRMALLEAVWFGRYAVEMDYRWADDEYETLKVKGWIPRHGDKLAFEHETGRVGIYVKASQKGDTRYGSEARVKMFDAHERARLIVHKHEIEDGEFFEPELAGMIHGVGLRTRVYWPWWIKQTASQWLMEFLERSALGITIWFYEAGNPLDQAATEAAAKAFTGSNVLLAPFPIGTERQIERVRRIEPSTGGAEMFKSIMDDYLGRQIRGMIIGQESSSQKVQQGLGSGVSDLQNDTKRQIIEFDSINLGETFTEDGLSVIAEWNYGTCLDFKPRFEIVAEDQDPEKVLQAAKLFQEMGGQVGERQLRDMIGLAEPDESDRILGQSTAVPTTMETLFGEQTPEPLNQGTPPAIDGGIAV